MDMCIKASEGRSMRGDMKPNDKIDVEMASRALFRLGRKFARFPLHELLETDQRHSLELSYILVVQAIEERQKVGQEANIGSIAADLEIEASTASRLVAAAERAGYIMRKKSSADGRATLIELTQAGIRLAQDARGFQKSVFEAITATWSDEERAIFVPLFIRFVDDLIEMWAEQKSAAASSPKI
jgi:DNA-binding MarR family transcriptional regulator